MRRNTVKKTKLLPVLLLSILVIAIVVLTVGAMHVGDLGNGVEWEFNDETGELRIFGDGPILEEGFSYWSQSSPFYEHNTNPIGSIVTVVIEEGINAIGNGAFSGQQAIKSISIPDSVTSIGERALGDCYALESVTIPGSVETIGDYAFSNCMSLKSVDIQNGVKSIGEGAFAACLELEGVTIPGSVETIGNLVFAHCISLQTVAIDETNTHFSFDGDILYNKDKTVLISYTGAGQPSELTIPDGVEEISRGAIAFALALERIFIPGTVITIGENAFFGCPTLVDVVIGKDSRLSVIGDEAFSGCTMLNSINLPDGLLTIGERAFAGCESLESILIPGSVKTIGEEAFRECESLESLEIRYGVESIGDSAFIVCISLESIIIPGSVKTIGEYAFGWCESLKNVDIPDSVETIGEGAFWGCTALESAVLGTGITSIDSWVFADCPELLHVIAQAQGAFAIDDDAFLNSPNVMIWAPFDSGAIAEASRMSMRYAYIPTSDEMISSIGAIETVYKNVPFEFVPVTGVQDNYGLLFDLQGTLPAGLAFDDGRDPASGYIPGTIYGVPQTTDEFEFIISATPRGLEGVYSASAEFTLVIADPLDPVDGLDFEEEVYSSKDEYEITYDDDYEVDGHIGILNEDESRYEITGYRGEVEDQILYIGNAPFELFAGLWINGEKQRQSTDLSIRNGYDYYAEDGSTRVTIFAQTIQDLDNGEYIAVAAFRGDDGEPVIADESGYIWLTDFENMLDIVAQRFYVDLTVPGSDNPNNNGSNNYDYGDYDYGSYDPDVTTPGGQGIADQVRNDDGGDTTSGGTASGGTATPGPDGPPPSEEGGNGAEAPGGTASGGTTPGGTAPDGTAPGGTAPGGTAPGGTAPGGTAPGGTTPGGTAPGGTATGGTAPDGTAPGGQGIADQVRNDEGGTTPAGTAFSGLPVGPDGNFYFDLDGSGNPMVLRIDIPFEEFEQLRMNGQTWAQGTDYSAASGSTVITIGADRLDRLDAGTHTLAAVFESETVEIVFTLNKAGPAGASPSAPGGAASSAIGGGPADITTPAQNGGALPFIIAGAAVVVLAAAVTLIVRKKRAA